MAGYPPGAIYTDYPGAQPRAAVDVRWRHFHPQLSLSDHLQHQQSAAGVSSNIPFSHPNTLQAGLHIQVSV